ncbi:MAG: Ig-like domain repeat protein, partial [Actinobacteria bacterium]|nr:Ig-like domain repeat protein [Actinomycetota bacterium]
RSTSDPSYPYADWGTIHHSGLPAGDYTLRVQYVPGNFMSDSRLHDAHVGLAPSTITSLTQSNSTSVTGEDVTLTATVAAATPSAIDLAHGAHKPGNPAGSSIEFLVDGGSIASAVVDEATGRAVLHWTILSGGTHTIKARFLTDGNYDTSPDSAAISHTVTKGEATNTLTQTSATTVFGQPFDLKATVAAVAPSTGIPSGAVTFTDTTTASALGAPALNGGSPDVASLTTSALGVGSHSVTAAYAGDGAFNPKTSSPITHTVNKATTAATLTSPTANPTTLGHPVTFNAAVAVVAPGAGTPTGAVQFNDGATTLGPPVPLSGTAATLTTSTLGGGVHSITATYLGDANFNPSTSAPLSRTLTCDYNLTGWYNGSYSVSPTGTTCITNANINGGVDVPAGARLSIVGSNLNGYLNSYGSAGTIVACGNTILGITISGATGALTIGDPFGAGCAANSISGSVGLSGNRAGIQFLGNSVRNGMQVTNTSGGATVIGGNRIAGWLQCSGNNPAATNGGRPNTASGRTGECATPATF